MITFYNISFNIEKKIKCKIINNNLFNNLFNHLFNIDISFIYYILFFIKKVQTFYFYWQVVGYGRKYLNSDWANLPLLLTLFENFYHL